MKLGLTIGDPCGIGYELWQKLSSHQDLVLIDNEDELEKFTQMEPKANAEAGLYAYRTLEKAHQMALNSEIDAIITGPVSKEALYLSGLKFNGQTEILAHLNGLGSQEIQMFFVAAELRIVLASRHIPLNQAAKQYLENMESCLDISIPALNSIFNIKTPRIAVCGLNPHAGEKGILGQEEILLEPCLQKLRNKYPYSEISSPLAADALLAAAGQQYLHREKADYDLYVAAYHDQGLAMIKAVAGYQAVNLSVGLPYLRVSVDHGTAFDIVGKNKANSKSLEACIKFLRQVL